MRHHEVSINSRISLVRRIQCRYEFKAARRAEVSDASNINVRVSPSSFILTLERLVEADRVSGSNALNMADNCSFLENFSRTVAFALIYRTSHSRPDTTILGPTS